MSKPFPQESLCFSWKSYHTEELGEWAVEFSPFADGNEMFSISTPDGREHLIDELETVRGLHALLGEAIKKAEEIEKLGQNERKKTHG
jgi:hypothetical protein